MDDVSPVHSLDWIKNEMAKKELPKLMMASEMGPVAFVTTGIKSLDAICKGFPLSRVTEIYGLEGVGKTSITLMSIAGMQKDGKKVLFCDVENSLNPARAEFFGVDLKKLAITTEVTVEMVAEIILAHLSEFDAIVVDSIAGMTVEAEFSGNMGESHMGLKARVMGQFMRKIIGPLGKSKCALIFINQQRMNMEMFTAKYTTPGGKATPYASSLRIELKSPRKSKIEKTIKGVKTQVGQTVTAVITKSKVSMPYATTDFDIMY